MHDVASGRQPAQRMFFALLPDAALQQALHRIGQGMRSAFGGRVVATGNIHLTLAFLGSVPVARVDELRDVGASVRTSSFSLELNVTGCWRRSAVGWIAPGDPPQPLDDLARELRQRLAKSQFHVDDKPFAPHVTLLRKARCKTRPEQGGAASSERSTDPNPPVVWNVDRFVLMRSDTMHSGPEYTQVGAWPLK